MGPVEAAPEYRVIVDANNLTVEIENELSECQEGLPTACLCLSGPGRIPGHSLCQSSRGPAPRPLILAWIQTQLLYQGDFSKREGIFLSCGKEV